MTGAGAGAVTPAAASPAVGVDARGVPRGACRRRTLPYVAAIITVITTPVYIYIYIYIIGMYTYLYYLY